MSWFGGKKKIEPKDEPEKHRARIWNDSDFDSFIAQCKDSSPEWVEAYHDKKAQLTVWKKKIKNSDIAVLRARQVFPNADPATLYDVLHDHEFRKTWDDNMIEGYTLETLDVHNTVGYYAARMPTPISNRDFVNQRSWLVRKDAEVPTWIICNHSVIHDSMKDRSGFVRGWSYQTGYLVEAHPEGGAVFTYSTQADPKGWIPAWAINSAITTLGPRLLAKLGSVVPKYEAWFKENRKDGHRPWLTPPTTPRGEGEGEEDGDCEGEKEEKGKEVKKKRKRKKRSNKKVEGEEASTEVTEEDNA
eukprot:TRINITY_DN573_c1_g1_i1.p1 TRINITY_DN573_c1_g1~~TRINITY_DN573_c1_g1_i1.p1  ORF type:complete len:302 (-),score=80.07 TRINITY_DN573_c1_g1_i1:55-960(-)